MNTKKTILLITLLILLIGIASATEVSANSTTTKIVKDTSDAHHVEVEKSSDNIVEKKTIKKEEDNNVKTASKTVDVSDFSTLHDTLTSDTYDSVTMNIKKDITLTGDTTLNKAIKTLMINGNGKTVDGNKNYTFLYINSESTINITNIKIINCFAEYNGGAIYNNHGNITITNTTLDNNKAENGGAIYNTRGDITIKNTNLNKNIGGDDGGAIYNTNGNLIITNSTLDNNKAENGGAISSYNKLINTYEVIDKDMILTGVIRSQKGDAVYIYSSSTGIFTITNSTLNNNVARNYGGAIYNLGNDVDIINSIFSYNTAYRGSAIYLDSSSYNSSKKFIERTYVEGQYEGGTWIKRVEYGSNGNPVLFDGVPYYYENVGGTWVGPHYDKRYEFNESISGINIVINNNTFTKNKANIYKLSSSTTIAKNGKNMIIENNNGENKSKYKETVYVNSTNVYVTNNIFEDGIDNVTIELNPIKGVIGENITLTAYLRDSDYDKINGGNLAFKLNGKTLRSDGRFDSNAPTMKFSVKNGLVTYTIKADLYLRNAKNLEASYSGTSNYYESISPSVTAQIQKRNAQVTVTSTPRYAKQYETLTFTMKATDTTKNGKNNTLIYDNTKVMLKVNGVTLKDNNGKTLYITLDKNAQATYKYTIPAGTGGITASKATRNYTVTAIFVGDNYYPGAKNITKFQVERSTTNVQITQAKVTSNNVLSVKATLKDYKGNNLIGTNKVTIKINGKSYTKNGKPVYWSVKNGNVDLTGIQVDPKTTIKRVLLVTGERQAYLEGRSETTNIQRI